MTYLTNSEQETFDLAAKFSRELSGGEVLCLIGDLGAGKTAFTKGLAAGLGVEKIITSPTFVLMKNYESQKHKNTKTQKPLMLVHVDAYRLSNGEELDAIGINDYINDWNCITVIEWADRVKDIWPKDAIEINFKTLDGDQREIEIKK